MIELKIKPLSVNEAWQGKRYKTAKYLKYERDVLFLLPKICPKFDRYSIILVFGVSNINSDIDNPVKLILDLFQKKYKFNDKHVFELNVKKEIVKKGSEYIKFLINEYKL
jgi:Holliday junction resolvase RusA-like endonuclease